ncbi:MAG: hypothetical protein DRQ37_04180 [Gammaproteobacteria bacterium]|nr:MAG: hypothetical protein DRQ37_04180 [Gammaproteobacteria bacterium]
MSAFGLIAMLSSIIFFAGSFFVENDIGKAFALGAFFSGLIGSILLFGFSKVIHLLEAIRIQTAPTEETEPTIDEKDEPG